MFLRLFLATSGGPQTCSTTYLFGERIYYEIKLENFPRTDEFSWILIDICEAGDWHQEEYPDSLLLEEYPMVFGFRIAQVPGAIHQLS